MKRPERVYWPQNSPERIARDSTRRRASGGAERTEEASALPESPRGNSRNSGLPEAVTAIGRNVTGVQGDVAKLADLDRLYETVGKVKGRIDIIFANAGVGEFVPFGKVSEEHFDRLFNINVKGALFTVQKGLPLLNDGGCKRVYRSLMMAAPSFSRAPSRV